MKKVLVVDDNLLDRLLISRRITNEYNEVTVKEAKDGIDALNKIASNDFDLVITDVVMPKMEGLELINEIRKINSTIPIIAISGGNPYYLYLAKKSGVTDVFTKPLPAEMFLSKISHYLGHKHQILA